MATSLHPRVYVNPMAVHNASDKIDYAKLVKFYENYTRDHLEEFKKLKYNPPESMSMGELISNLLIDINNANDDTDEMTKKHKLLDKILKTRIINHLNFLSDNLNKRISLSWTLLFVKMQPPLFKKAYIDAFIEDCTKAYEGPDGMTCPRGAIERIVLSVISAIRAMNTIGEGNRELNTLADIIENTVMYKNMELNHSIKTWYKEHKTGPDGKATGFGEGENRRANLKAYLLNKYPNEERWIEEKITEIADIVEYDDDNFNMTYGGRRRCRPTQLQGGAQFTHRNRMVSRTHSKGKINRKGKTRKVKKPYNRRLKYSKM